VQFPECYSRPEHGEVLLLSWQRPHIYCFKYLLRHRTEMSLCAFGTWKQFLKRKLIVDVFSHVISSIRLNTQLPEWRMRLAGLFSVSVGSQGPELAPFRGQKDLVLTDNVVVWTLKSLATILSAACYINFLPFNMACCLHTNTFVFPLLVLLQLTVFHQMRYERYAIGGRFIICFFLVHRCSESPLIPSPLKWNSGV
jgi:hypothetical protein